ncbi:MAG: PH domain-containing protein [Clostridia bacterium]|nr:PH domain-containing protein [Clostridia bacterium]
MKKRKKTQSSAFQDIADENMKKGKISFDDQVVRVFDEVLESDEKIVKGFKPNKAKVFWSKLLLTGIPCLCIALLGLFAFLFPDKETSFAAALIIMIVFLVLSSSIFACSVWFTCIYFKNTYYVYTNKRVIIQTGIFGVDLKSLELKDVVTCDVRISLFDKLIRKHTGTIKFGSGFNSGSGSSETVQDCVFAHIENPDDVCKEINEFIKNQDIKK